MSQKPEGGGGQKSRAALHPSKPLHIASRVPSATYRLQFNASFGLTKARVLIDYLRELGISDVYASPLLQAGASSTHGYDVCAFDRLNVNLGTLADFERLTATLRDSGMGLLLDIVPNHMRADSSNCWFADVLIRGPNSPYGRWFDMDWNSQLPNLNGKILLPILEDHYATVLESGKLRLVQTELNETFSRPDRPTYAIAYHDRILPLNDDTQRLLGRDARVNGPQRLLDRYNGHAGNPKTFDALHQLLQQQSYRLCYWRLASEIINYRRFFDVTDLIALRMELPEVFSAAHELVLEWCKEGKVTGLRVDHPDGLFDPKEYFERLQKALKGDRGRGQPQFYVVAEKILSGGEQLPSDWPVAGTTGYDFLNRLNGLFVDPKNERRFDSIYSEFTGCGTSFQDIARAAKCEVLQKSFGAELDRITDLIGAIAARTRYGQDLTRTTLKAALVQIIGCFPVYRTYAIRDSKRLTAAETAQVQTALRNAKALVPGAEHGSRSSLNVSLEFITSLLLLNPPRDVDVETRAACRDFVIKFQQLTGPVTAKGVEDTAFYRYNRLVSLNEVGGHPSQFGITIEKVHEGNRIAAQFWPHSLLATATHDTKRGEDVRARINVLSEMPGEWRKALSRWSGLNAQHKSVVNGSPAPDANDEYLLYQIMVGAWPGASDLTRSPSFCERVQEYMLKACREAKRHTTWTDPNPEYEEAIHRFIERILSHTCGDTPFRTSRLAGHNADTPGRPSTFLTDFEKFQRAVAFFGQFNSLSQAVLKLTCPGAPDIYQGTELWDLSLVDPDNRRPVDFELRKACLAELKQKFGSGANGVPDLTTDDQTENTLKRGNQTAPVADTLKRGHRTGLLGDTSKREHLADQFGVHALACASVAEASQSAEIRNELATYLQHVSPQTKLFLIWRVLQFRNRHRELFEHGSYIPLFAEGAKRDHICAFARTWRGQAAIVVAPRLFRTLLNGSIRLLPLGRRIWKQTSLVLPRELARPQFHNVITGDTVPTRRSKTGTRLDVAKILSNFPVALLTATR